MQVIKLYWVRIDDEFSQFLSYYVAFIIKNFKGFEFSFHIVHTETGDFCMILVFRENLF